MSILGNTEDAQAAEGETPAPERISITIHASGSAVLGYTGGVTPEQFEEAAALMLKTAQKIRSSWCLGDIPMSAYRRP